MTEGRALLGIGLFLLALVYAMIVNDWNFMPDGPIVGHVQDLPSKWAVEMLWPIGALLLALLVVWVSRTLSLVLGLVLVLPTLLATAVSALVLVMGAVPVPNVTGGYSVGFFGPLVLVLALALTAMGSILVLKNWNEERF